MYKIALCDDDERFTSRFTPLLEQLLREKGADWQLSRFTDTGELLRSVESGGEYDLLFLDIVFGTEQGIRLARTLRERRYGAEIVFVTSSPDFAVEGYDAAPLHYLIKPVDREKLETALDRFLEKRAPQVVRFDTPRGLLQLRLADILYFEIYSHDIVIHVAGGRRESCVGSLKELEALLPRQSFVRPHRSYLVNLDHIAAMSRYHIRLTSGETVPVSKNLYQQVQGAFIDHADQRALAY